MRVWLHTKVATFRSVGLHTYRRYFHVWDTSQLTKAKIAWLWAQWAFWLVELVSRFLNLKFSPRKGSHEPLIHEQKKTGSCSQPITHWCLCLCNRGPRSSVLGCRDSWFPFPQSLHQFLVLQYGGCHKILTHWTSCITVLRISAIIL